MSSQTPPPTSLIAPNLTLPMKDFTVEDHLRALGDTPDWVITLGNALQEITGCDPAVAASRARDMSSNQILAQGVEHFATGWLEIKPALSSGLTPWQRGSLLLLVDGICSYIKEDLSSPK